MGSYEQSLKLFVRWLKENMEIENAEQVKEPHIRAYIANNDGITSKGTRASGKNLYQKYTIKGSLYDREARGEEVDHSNYKERNFLDYVRQAKKIFGDIFIDTVTPRHMYKIKKMCSLKRKAYKRVQKH